MRKTLSRSAHKLHMENNHPTGPLAMKRKIILTGRQLQVIMLVVNGYSNRDLAQTLGISEHTAKAHLTNIYGKLGAHNRLELVLIAVQERLF